MSQLNWLPDLSGARPWLVPPCRTASPSDGAIFTAWRRIFGTASTRRSMSTNSATSKPSRSETRSPLERRGSHMAEMTIRLRCDPNTGKKDIIISLRSDEDALPHEHEQQHKSLVEKLIHKGLLTASELGQIVVDREEEEATPAAPVPTTPAEERKSVAR